MEGILHGTTINQINGFYNVVDRSARKLLNDVDLTETIRISQITNALYDKVYDYQLPADVKGERIIDIRPQVNRTALDRFFRVYNTAFDINKAELNGTSLLAIQNNSGVKSMRIAKDLITGINLDFCDSLTSDGTWIVGGTASNLSLDSINYVGAGGSIRCDLGSGANPSTGYVEKTKATPVDLSRDLNIGTIFMFVYIPSASGTTSVSLRWGSDSSNYWTATATSAWNNTAFQNGWNQVGFDWASATKVGSPNSSAIDYIRVSCTYNGTAQSAFRFDSIVSQLGTIYEIEYYSKYLFRTAGGTWQERVTADDNIVNLDTDSFDMLLSLVAFYCSQQVQGVDSKFDYQFFMKDYEEARNRYVAKNRSQAIKPRESYYSMPTKKVKFVRWY